MPPPSIRKRPVLWLTILLVLFSQFAISCTSLLHQQALRLHAEGRYAEAIPVMQKVLAMEEEQQGIEHPDTAHALNNLAALYYDTRDYAQAEPLHRRALAIREKVLGFDHPNTAQSLNSLARLYQAIGAYTKAEPLYHRAIAIIEKVLGPEHLEITTVLNNLATLYQDTGSYAKAELLLQRVLMICGKMLGPEDLQTAFSRNNLAQLYQDRGSYGMAEPLYHRALAIFEKGLGLEHPNTATVLSNLAMLYRDTRAYIKAEPLLQRVLTIREKILGPEDLQTAFSLNNLAQLYQDRGAYGKAEPLLQRALEIIEKVLGPEHPLTATLLNNLALLYMNRGAYGKAEPLFQRVLGIIEKVLGPEHSRMASSLNNLALLYENIGNYAKAESFLRQALTIHEKSQGAEHPLLLHSLFNMALLQWRMNGALAALPFLERCQLIEKKNTTQFLLTGSELRKQDYLQGFRGMTAALISLSLVPSSPIAPMLALSSVLAAKGRVLDAMSDSFEHLRKSVKLNDRALLNELRALAQQQSALMHQGIGKLQPEVYRQLIQELSSKQEHLESELSKRSEEFRKQTTPMTLAGVQAAIPDGAGLLEWYRYEPVDPKAKNQSSQWSKPRYVAYVLRSTGEPAVVDIGDAETIEQMIHDFRSGLAEPTSAFVQEDANKLYGILLKPLEQHLGTVDHLLISPDGALNMLPFAALRDESGTYLGARTTITYLTSGRDLVGFGAMPAAKSDVVLVADPDYGPSAKPIAQVDSTVQPSRSIDLDRGGMVFLPLPGTADEAKTLKTLLKISDDQVLTQTKATEDRFKEIQGPRILHVATHGFFLKDNELPTAALSPGSFFDKLTGPLGENPLLRSGLALAGANQRRSGEKDDGILTAVEVAQMDLRGTQLVVLSACETGVGDVQNGEGVYGLRRALVLAGAETQVTSLWKVADEATKDLMVDYYTRLLKGEGRSEALRNAQLTMMNSKDRSHPYYWAAFVPIGNWAPLAKGK